MTDAQRAKSQITRPAWPPAVAVAGWLLPGAGYWMIGHRARGITVGITIIALFVLGLLIGGVRALEVPGYGPNGRPIQLVDAKYERGEPVTFDLPVEKGSQPPAIQGYVLLSYQPIGPIMTTSPFDEIRDKPWSIAEVMAGPISIAAGAWSVEQSWRESTSRGMLPAAGSRSHARLNEIGVLYLAVAGMLNLMAIIDAAFRAAHPHVSDPAPATAAAIGQGGQA